jgi:hypothetical protein
MLMKMTGSGTGTFCTVLLLALGLGCGGETRSVRGEEGLSDLEDPTTFEQRRADSPPVYSPADFVGAWAMTVSGSHIQGTSVLRMLPHDERVTIEPGISSELEVFSDAFSWEGCEFLADLIGAGFEFRLTSCREGSTAWGPAGGDASLAADGVMKMRIRAQTEQLASGVRGTWAADLRGSRAD